MPEELKLVDKGKTEKRKKWSSKTLQEITVGSEGEKSLSEFKLGETAIKNGLFIKRVRSKKEGLKQKEKWQAAKKRKIPTSKMFRVAEDENGNFWVVSEDLTENGQRWVVSRNNLETVESDDFKQAIDSIDDTTRTRITRSILDIAMSAGQADSDGNYLSLSEAYMMGANPFMTSISKANPNDVQIMLQDFGADVAHVNIKQSTKRNEEDIQRGNVTEAIIFLINVFNIVPTIPKSHPAYKYHDDIFNRSLKLYLWDIGLIKWEDIDFEK